MIEQLNKTFDHIYVLTLEEAKERHELMKSRFPGLDYEFFYGVNKNHLVLDELIDQKVYDDELTKSHRRQKTSMSMGQIACSYSHKNIYEDIVSRGFKNALILEDDVFLEEKIGPAYLEKAMSELPTDWGLLYLGYHKNEHYGPKEWWKTQNYLLLRSLGLHQWSKLRIRNRYPKDYSEHLKVAGNHESTYSYAVSASASILVLQTL